jgi:hypothetical protein
VTPKDSPNLRPAQVLLSDADRDHIRRIQARSLTLGTDAPGPTTIFRAGLRALDAASDDALMRVLDQAETRLDLEALTAHFETWCQRIGAAVAAADSTLVDAYEAACPTHQVAAIFPSRVGHFSNQSRFAVLSLMQDGRVLISGVEVVIAPIQFGQKIPHTKQLFPGLAVTLSMNEDGAALATRSLVAWLLEREGELPEIRAAFDKHQAQKLR